MTENSREVWDQLGECDPDMTNEEFLEMVNSIEIEERESESNTHCPACGKPLNDTSWWQAGIWISDGVNFRDIEFYPDPSGEIYCTEECADKKSRFIQVTDVGAKQVSKMPVRCKLCKQLCDPCESMFVDGEYICSECEKYHEKAHPLKRKGELCPH